MIAALQVLGVVAGCDKPVSEVCGLFETVPQILENVRYKGGQPLEHKQVVAAITDGEARLGEGGRLVIRPSGTEPLIRVMAEGRDDVLVRQVVGDIVAAVAEVAA